MSPRAAPPNSRTAPGSAGRKLTAQPEPDHSGAPGAAGQSATHHSSAPHSQQDSANPLPVPSGSPNADATKASPPQVSVLIPAHNEADYIADCLCSLFGSELPEGLRAEALVLANGCTDATVQIAGALTVPPAWHLKVLTLAEGNKIKALNEGDAQARGDVLIYLDADVTLEPALLGQIAAALGGPTARYASGTPQLSPAKSALSRAYGRFWMRLPFVQNGTPGFGLFAMSRAGRARWQDWPDIIADDTFARLNFAPAERVTLPARYSWPLIEGMRNLIRVRRRQNAGVAELIETHPNLQANDDKTPLSPVQLVALLAQDPIGFAAYAMITVAVQSPLYRSAQRWERGR